MNSSNLFTWLGIGFGVIGILIGIWGIYITRKYRRIIQYNLVVINSIVLFDTIVKNIPELSISYKGSEINPDLILIECALVNTGTSAVLTDMIEEPVILLLPEEHKWVAVEKVISSPGMNIDLSLPVPQKMVINSGLFKVGDFIRFKALLLVPRDNIIFQTIKMGNLDKIISITHRIADMKDIIIINLKKLNTDKLLKLDSKKLRRLYIKYSGFILIILIFFISFATKKINIGGIFKFFTI